uniref:Uncharacterized protein n=1 Tax=Brassica campestris TaxID=3711 RepID=A0A3P6BDJ6_BRACM|nr:unnamed protein product [Brassica rapa]
MIFTLPTLFTLAVQPALSDRRSLELPETGYCRLRPVSPRLCRSLTSSVLKRLQSFTWIMILRTVEG